MMLDRRGQLFGRINVFDALLMLFLLCLVPVGYATYLLFRPATPSIASVDRVEITREERRLAGGSVLTAKLKVRGSGFSPMLRAAVGTMPAIGFVFENPNSADVMVGEMPPGTYDLILLDGAQEVARARDVVRIEPSAVPQIRAVGYFVGLTAAEADALAVGAAPPAGDAPVRIVALGAPRPGYTRLRVGDGVADVPSAGHLERPAVISVRCDARATDEPCTIGGIAVAGRLPIVTLPGMAWQARFAVTEVLPDAPPHPARLTVRFSGGAELQQVAVGDRDALLDERAAVVAAITGRGANAASAWADAIVDLGVDPSRDGWRYRGQLVRPGGELSLQLPAAMVRGTVHTLTMREAEGSGR